MMNFAYCICPSITNSNLDIDNLDELAMNVLSKKASIIIDRYNILMAQYSNQLTEQNVESFEFFEKLLQRHHSRVIESEYAPAEPLEFEDDNLPPKIVLDITSAAKTTRAKYIICQNDSLYSDFESEAFENRLSVITATDEICSAYPDFRVHIEPLRLKKQISFSLRSMADRQCFKKSSEDECNDQIRDLLINGGYLVKDQTRRGVAQSGYSVGEVDLMVYCGNEPYAIIEAMILTSVNTGYIHSHMNKALTKYDNLGLRDCYILVYYRGANFNEFSTRYFSYVSTLTTLNGNPTSPVTIESHSMSEPIYSGYREINSIGRRRDVSINCIHMLIDQ
jgi:hypothetical protein